MRKRQLENADLGAAVRVAAGVDTVEHLRPEHTVVDAAWLSVDRLSVDWLSVDWWTEPILNLVPDHETGVCVCQ